jgi:hypothetical protein
MQFTCPKGADTKMHKLFDENIIKKYKLPLKTEKSCCLVNKGLKCTLKYTKTADGLVW